MLRMIYGAMAAMVMLVFTVTPAIAQTEQQQAEEAIGFADSWKQVADWNYITLAEMIEDETDRWNQYYSLIPYFWESMTPEEQDTVDAAMVDAYNGLTNPTTSVLVHRNNAYDHILDGDVELSLAVEYYEDTPPLYALAKSAAEAAAKYVGSGQPATGHYPEAGKDIISGEVVLGAITEKLNEVESVLSRFVNP